MAAIATILRCRAGSVDRYESAARPGWHRSSGSVHESRTEWAFASIARKWRNANQINNLAACRALWGSRRGREERPGLRTRGANGRNCARHCEKQVNGNLSHFFPLPEQAEICTDGASWNRGVESDFRRGPSRTPCCLPHASPGDLLTNPGRYGSDGRGGLEGRPEGDKNAVLVGFVPRRFRGQFGLQCDAFGQPKCCQLQGLRQARTAWYRSRIPDRQSLRATVTQGRVAGSRHPGL